jgi:hypothetical protein
MVISSALSVVSSMWLETILHNQYRHGTSTVSTFNILYHEDGVRRFYRGFTPALVSKCFGWTKHISPLICAVGLLNEESDVPIVFKALGASAVSHIMDSMFLPVDTFKVCM